MALKRKVLAASFVMLFLWPLLAAFQFCGLLLSVLDEEFCFLFTVFHFVIETTLFAAFSSKTKLRFLPLLPYVWIAYPFYFSGVN